MLDQYAAIMGRTFLSNHVHGAAPTITYESEQWLKVNSKIDWVKSTNTQWVSVGSSRDREHIIFNENSEKIRHLKQEAIQQCQDKIGNIHEILSTVNEIVNQLTDQPKVSRRSVESGLDDLLTNFIRDKKLSNHASLESPAITIDELIDEKILVCRHKGLLVASLLAELVRQGILPEGTVRQYRTQLDTGGVHTFATYREKSSNELYICDPRWQYVENVSKSADQVAQKGYGINAVQIMVDKLNILDENSFRPKQPALILREQAFAKFNIRHHRNDGPYANEEEKAPLQRNVLSVPLAAPNNTIVQQHPVMIQRPEPIIEFLNDNVFNAYADLKREQNFRVRFMKRLGRPFNDKAENRAIALIRMSDLFQKLRTKNEISVFEKAKILYSYMYNVKERIHQENNRYDSALNILCENYKYDLRYAFRGHPEMMAAFDLVDNNNARDHDQYVERGERIISGERVLGVRFA